MIVDRPVLIGCAPSSGSTLLSVLLDAHPQLACGPELAILSNPGLYCRPWSGFQVDFVRALGPWSFDATDALERLVMGFCPYNLHYVDHLAYYGFKREQMCDLVRVSDSPSYFFQQLFGPLLRRTGKSRWAEKSPSNLYAFQAFLDCFPSGKIVFLVRHGLDLVCSLLKRGFGLKRAIGIWMVETALCERMRDHPRAFRISYEELAAKPQGVIEGLLDFLELDQAVDAVMANRGNGSQGADVRPMGLASWRSRPGDPITTRSVGRWQEDLDPETLTICLASRFAEPPPGLEELRGQTFIDLLRRSGYEAPAAPMASVTHGVCERLARDQFLACGEDYLGSHLFHERFICSEPVGLGSAQRQALRADARLAIQCQASHRARRTLREVGQTLLEVIQNAQEMHERLSILESLLKFICPPPVRKLLRRVLRVPSRN